MAGLAKLQRWQAFSGRAAVLEGQGRDFAALAVERSAGQMAGVGVAPA